MAKKTTLKSKKDNEILYPQTTADIVNTLDGGNVEQKLQNIEDLLSGISQSQDYKGYFPNYDALVDSRINPETGKPYGYPNDIPNPSERQGWYARVGGEGTGDTTIYYWDVEGNAWIKGSSISASGVSSVNGEHPNEEGNLTLTASNIPTGYTNQDGSNKNVQEVFNMLQGEHLDLADEINGLESEINKIDDKTTVLYLSNEEMESAVSPSQLLSKYEDGQVVVCNDDGNYKLGSSYKYIVIETEDNPVNAWEEITSSGGSASGESITLTKDVYSEAVGNGSVTYENLTTNTFTEDSEGYYVSSLSSQGTAVIKLTFNLEQPTKIKFISSSEVTSTAITSTDSQFSEINVSLGENVFGSDKVYANVTKASNIITTYTLPAGESFITIRNSRGYNTGSLIFKFKLLTEFNTEPKFEKTVENIISIDDNGELLSNEDILATNKNINLLVGTTNEPINLQTLPVGNYKLKGYFVYAIGQGVPNQILNESTIDITVYKFSNTSYHYATIHNASLNKRSESHQTSYSSDSPSISSIINDLDDFNLLPSTGTITFRFDNNTSNLSSIYYMSYFPTDTFLTPIGKTLDTNNSGNNQALTTKNTNPYTPTSPYHPATKDYVDGKKAFLINKNPEEYFTSDYFGTFIMNTENSELYACSEVINSTLVDLASGNLYSAIIIDKTIIDGGFGGNLITLRTNNSSANAYLSFSSGNLRVTGNFNSSYWDGYLYQNGEWKYETIEPIMLNKTATKIKLSTIYSSNSLNYFKGIVEEQVITPIRVALYNDIQNSGGGEVVTSKPINEFAEPYVEPADEYKNTFGTSTDPYDNALYYYKNRGEATTNYHIINAGMRYDNININKGLTNFKYSNGTSSNVILQCNAMDKSIEKELGTFSINLSTDESGNLLSLYIPEYSIDIYTTSNGWIEGYDLDTNIEWISIMKVIKDKITEFKDANALDITYTISKDINDEIYTATLGSYFVGEIIEGSSVVPVRIALYDDLAGAGGSSAKPITKFDFPDAVNDGFYNDSFGTGIGQDNRLYFYKDSGTKEIYTPLRDAPDLKMQMLNVSETVVDDGYWSQFGTGVLALNFNLSNNDGSEETVTLNFNCVDGVLTQVYILPFMKEDQEYLYNEGKWLYNTINTYYFNDYADTMIFSGDIYETPITSYLNIVDVVSSLEAIRVALYSDITNGGGSSGSGVSYAGEYEPYTSYNKDTIIHYSNHFFICLENGTTNVTPNINMFYTEEGGIQYWRNMGYSATYADNSINDGDGNNISNTYATKEEVGSTFVDASFNSGTQQMTFNLKNGGSKTVLIDGVPNTRTINGKPLSSNVTLTADDISLDADNTVLSGFTGIAQYVAGLNASNIKMSSDSEETISEALNTTLSQIQELLDSTVGDQVTYNLTGTTLTITPKTN